MPDNTIRLPYTAQEVQQLLAVNQNYIAPETAFHIEADGSGDFQTIEACLQYLQGKHCPGYVTILLGEGTFVVTDCVILGISGIYGISLVGSGTAKTTISFDASECGAHFHLMRCNRNSRVLIDHIAFSITDPPEGFRCIQAFDTSLLVIGIVKIKSNSRSHDSWAIMSEEGSIIKIKNAEIENFYYGATAADALLFVPWGGSFSFTNVVDCFRSSDGGYVGISHLSAFNVNNITNRYKQEFGGIINHYD